MLDPWPIEKKTHGDILVLFIKNRPVSVWNSAVWGGSLYKELKRDIHSTIERKNNRSILAPLWCLVSLTNPPSATNRELFLFADDTTAILKINQVLRAFTSSIYIIYIYNILPKPTHSLWLTDQKITGTTKRTATTLGTQLLLRS